MAYMMLLRKHCAHCGGPCYYCVFFFKGLLVLCLLKQQQQMQIVQAKDGGGRGKPQRPARHPPSLVNLGTAGPAGHQIVLHHFGQLLGRRSIDIYCMNQTNGSGMNQINGSYQQTRPHSTDPPKGLIELRDERDQKQETSVYNIRKENSWNTFSCIMGSKPTPPCTQSLVTRYRIL